MIRALWVVLVLLGCAARAPQPIALGDATFDGGSMRQGDIALSLRAMGRGHLDAVDRDAAAFRSGGDVRFVRAPGVTEWWREVASGLEQGVDIAEPPAGTGPLVLELDVGEGVIASGEGTIALSSEQGALLATYGGLSVIDAGGAAVPARMAAVDGSIRIEVDDHAARYPIVVDPIVTTLEAETRLEGSMPLGISVAINGAGDLVLATGDGATAGLRWQRSGTMWSEGTPFSPVDGTVSMSDLGSVLLEGTVDGMRLGPATRSVLSGDGSTAVLRPLFAGLTVYRRSGSSWSTESTALPSGSAFDVTDDGTRVAIALSGGGVEVWRRGSPWAREASFTAPAGAGVAISGDGLYLLTAGGPHARSGTTWTAMTGPSVAGDDAVLDATGTIGASIDSAGNRVLLHVRRGSVWSDGGTITLSGDVHSLDITPDGTRLVAGGTLGQVHVYRLGSSGDPCVAASDCVRGFCADGVCCDSDCGTSLTDCMACSVAAGAAVDGTCGPRPTTTVCRASAGGCDAEERCDSSGLCPADARIPGGTICRASAGPCDFIERCDGTSVSCASDTFEGAGTPCGGGGDDCTTAGMCDGSSALCRGGTALPSTTLCLPRDASNPCDADDYCDGVIGVCVPTYASADTVCGGTSSGTCDAPDHCSGTSADCVDTYLTATVCRTPAGPCDLPETCLGDSPDCPEDGFLAAGISCRPSMSACDPEEVCDGASASCPADMSCPTGDTGMSGPMVDAGTPVAPVAGCSCRVAASRSPHGLVVLAGLLLALLRRRR